MLTIKESRDIAFAETKRLFGVNGRNDKSDAFRHCFWSALLARDLGLKNAETFTTAHESYPNNPDNEKRMDIINNSVGLMIGKHGGNNQHLSTQCLSALMNGRLVVISR